MEHRYNISDVVSFFAIAGAFFAIGNMYFAETVFDFSRGISLESNKNIPITASITIFHCAFLCMLLVFRRNFNIGKIAIFFIIIYNLTACCIFLKSILPSYVTSIILQKDGVVGKIMTIAYIVNTIFIMPYCLKKITKNNVLESIACVLYFLTACFALLYVVAGKEVEAISLYKKDGEIVDIAEYKIYQNTIFYKDKKSKDFYIERINIVYKIDVKIDKEIETIYFKGI